MLSRYFTSPVPCLKRRCALAGKNFRDAPLKHLTIPLAAAFVGWLTNWLAVQMIFYPIDFWGFSLKRWPGVPLGLFGWQGIVPTKADVMAARIVDMVTEKLVDVPSVFRKLDPAAIAALLSPEVDVMASSIATEALPKPMTRFLRRLARFGVMGGGGQAGLQEGSEMVQSLRDIQRNMLEGLTRDLQRDPNAVLDVRALVVEALSTDKRVLVNLFRKVGATELDFLVMSGVWVGFALGLVQMVLYMFCQQRWTLVLGGTVVGLATNWIALKCIFEPVLPTPLVLFGHTLRWGGQVVTLQGRFMMRQVEVATEFAQYMTDHVLTSANIWKAMLAGPKHRAFRSLLDVRLRRAVASASQLAGLDAQALPVDGICDGVWRRLPAHIGCLHSYVDRALGLGPLMAERMRAMSPSDFEAVLHPIFQEDEATLTIIGGVMGGLVGLFQSKDSKGSKPNGSENGVSPEVAYSSDDEAGYEGDGME